MNNSLKKAFAWSIAAAAVLTGVIALTAPLLARFYPLLPDKGASWYFWQLPAATLASRLSAWGFYLAHQITLWVLVYKFSKEKPHMDTLSRLNILALALNMAFILLHVLQTQFFYDGLAQDVPVWSSQFSVIIMLVIMLYMLIPRRGFIAGWKPGLKPSLKPSLQPKLQEKSQAWVRSWHAYYIAWALCYTFWFHPTEGDFGLLSGFFYMFLLLIQLSFANTKLHFNLAWLALLEVMVGLHGPAIAIQKAMSGNEGDQTGPGIWIMFASGFLFMFVFTGQFGLKLGKPMRVVVFAAYAALVGSLYAWRGVGRLFEISFIPVALYGGTVALALIAAIWAKLVPGKPQVAK